METEQVNVTVTNWSVRGLNGVGVAVDDGETRDVVIAAVRAAAAKGLPTDGVVTAFIGDDSNAHRLRVRNGVATVWPVEVITAKV